jgi:hypothetical protein
VSAAGTVQGLAAAVLNAYDGREELHMYHDQATWSTHSAVRSPAPLARR